MYKKLIKTMRTIPEAYESTGIAFWNDEHISKSMLAAHLSPDTDGASRRHDFIIRSADWISHMCGAGSRLLDLGCGPGIYAEHFHNRGFDVTGIDFSKRSILYAKEKAAESGMNIHYIYQDYLDIDYDNEFDLITLIYCDFGVLAESARSLLLKKVYAALKPGGYFLVDAFLPMHYKDFTDNLSVSFNESGFWSADPYVCIKRDMRYADDVFLEQYTVITESEEQTHNLWNHSFTKPELTDAMQQSGFTGIECYGDAAGGKLDENCSVICAIGEKPKI